jgi:hypothetical protein
MANAQLVQRSVEDSKGLIRAPAFHKSGCEVVRGLKDALDRAECPGQRLEQRRFGELLGVSKSTIHDWFHGPLPAPIQSFLCACERLTETDRILLLRQFCRHCPRLEHPRLAHDAETLNLLKALLLKRTGVTLVVGPAEPRTFLVTSLGHSIAQADASRSACGLDVHRPDTFVPVAGVFYCERPPKLEQARDLVALAMDDVEHSDAEFVIFNGVSRYLTGITRLAANRHVVVADSYAPAPEQIASVCPELLLVSQIPGKQGLIRVDFRKP